MVCLPSLDIACTGCYEAARGAEDRFAAVYRLCAFQSLYSCGSSWYQGAWSEGCKECGGFPMKRPCCICEGKCCAVWTRNIDMVSALVWKEVCMSHGTHSV